MTMLTSSSLAPVLPAHARLAGVADLGAILQRIEEAIEAETAAIRTDVNFDVAASNARKSRHLYDLTRALRGQDDERILSNHRGDIERLRERLIVNQGAISAHLDAVGEVATLVQAALQEAEADGTYSQDGFRSPAR